MKYDVEINSGVVIYMPVSIKIVDGGGDTQTAW
jgi:hypothetical protein